MRLVIIRGVVDVVLGGTLFGFLVGWWVVCACCLLVFNLCVMAFRLVWFCNLVTTVFWGGCFVYLHGVVMFTLGVWLLVAYFLLAGDFVRRCFVVTVVGCFYFNSVVYFL